MRHLPRSACRTLTQMLSSIERGAQWPEQLAIAKCCYLAKTQEHNPSPLAYRGLVVAAVVYRTWAKRRSRELA
eukprot:5564554-Alexandrium_andersonii.AAC.1